jgi:hypothetical protein
MMGRGGFVEGNVRAIGRIAESSSKDELVIEAIDCPL